MTKIKYFVKGALTSASLMFMLIEAFLIYVFYGLWKDLKKMHGENKPRTTYRYDRRRNEED